MKTGTSNPPVPGFAFLVGTAMVGVVVVQMLVMMMGPLLVDMADDLGVGVPVAGQLAAATAVTWMVAAVVAGPLSDSYGRRPLLLISMGGAAVGAFGMALAWDFPSALAFRAITGLVGILPGTYSALLGDYIRPDQRGKAIGLMGVGVGIAGIIGVPLVTLLSDYQGWRWAFVVAGVLASLTWLYFLWFLPRAHERRPFNLNLLTYYRPLFRLAIVRDITLVAAFQRSAHTVFMTYYAAYLIVERGFTTAETALPIALVGIGLTVSTLGGGSIADTRFRMLAIPISLVVGGILGAVIFGIKLHAAATLTLGTIFPAFMFPTFPIMVAVFLTIGGSRLRGTAMGIPPISAQTGAILGPAVGGLALALGGFGAVGISCLALAGLGMALATLRLRERRIGLAAETIANLGDE
jgi:DHA1 family inner membrane transport protein